MPPVHILAAGVLLCGADNRPGTEWVAMVSGDKRQVTCVLCAENYRLAMRSAQELQAGRFAGVDALRAAWRKEA